MSFFTILIFALYSYGFGYTATSFVKEADSILERIITRLGIGMAIFPAVGLLLNVLHIPLDWRIFLALAWLYPVYHIIKHQALPKLNLKITTTDLFILAALGIFFWNFHVHVTGAFSYPYLEDDDSWGHATSVKFASVEKTVYAGIDNPFQYIEPYPPTYTIIMGVLHQTNDSMYWTLKYINALIVSLGTLFFFFFAKEFMRNRMKALLATFVLFSVPAFMSHFIWALALSTALYGLAFYCVERIRHDQKWWIVAGLVMVTTLTSSPTHSTYFGLLFAFYYITKCCLARKILVPEFLAAGLALVIAFATWWIPMIMRYTFIGTLQKMGIVSKAGKIQPHIGSGDRIYSFSDFYSAPMANMINNPVGIGKVVTILMFVGLVFVIYYLFTLAKSSSLPSHFGLIGKIGVIVSVVLLVFGCILFLNSDALQGQAGLSDHMKKTVFYVTLGLGVLILSSFVIAPSIDDNKKWLIITVAWFGLTFYAVNAAIYTYKISPFRAWMVLAIPVCLLAGQGAHLLTTAGKFIGRAVGQLAGAKKQVSYIGIFLVMIILFFGIYNTSTKQKIAVNTANWPPGAFWTNGEELSSYLWLAEQVPPNTPVFTFVNNGPIIGLDMYACHWCEDVQEYMKSGINNTGAETKAWLDQRGIQYLVIDGQTIRKHGENRSLALMQELAEAGMAPILQNSGAVIFRS